jgi:hypothetical protein
MDNYAMSLKELVQIFHRLFLPPKPVPVRVRDFRRPRSAGYLLIALLVVLQAGQVWAEGEQGIPSSLPDLLDPQVQKHYSPLQIGSVHGNPDLPLVMLVNTKEGWSDTMLVGLDARNGKPTWSLQSDPIILIARFTDPATVTELFFDPGFMRQGTPSGSFESVPDNRLEALPLLLQAFPDVPRRTFM